MTGSNDKVKAAEALAEKYGITLKEMAYIGDDLNDMELLRKVGFSACPSDAVDLVKYSVDYVSSQKGGDGAVRDFAQLILNTRQ